MNQKSYANIILVLIIVILLCVISYLIFAKNNQGVVEQTIKSTADTGASIASDSLKFKVSSPISGESWVANGSYAIKWQGQSTYDKVTIAIYDAKLAKSMIIGDEVPNVGSYVWNIPVDMPLANDYIISVYPAGARELVGNSGTFSIVKK